MDDEGVSARPGAAERMTLQLTRSRAGRARAAAPGTVAPGRRFGVGFMTRTVRLFRVCRGLGAGGARPRRRGARTPRTARCRPDRKREQVRPAELAAMLDAYAIVQAQNALQLTDAQYGQFVTRLKRLQENRRRNNQIRNRLLQQLRALAAPGGNADETAMREKLQALREHDEQRRRRCGATARRWTRCSTSGSRSFSGCSKSGSSGRSSTCSCGRAGVRRRRREVAGRSCRVYNDLMVSRSRLAASRAHAGGRSARRSPSRPA